MTSQPLLGACPAIDADDDFFAAAEASALRTELESRAERYFIANGTLGCVLRSGKLNDASLLAAAAVSSSWRAAINDPNNVCPGTMHIASRRRSAPPFYVDIARGSDDAAGTRSAPVATVGRAELLMYRCPHNLKYEYSRHTSGSCAYRSDDPTPTSCIKVRCDPSRCDLVRCSAHGCREPPFCLQHGKGNAHEREHEACFCIVKCKADGCRRAFCSRHASRMNECDACRQVGYAHVSCGACDDAGGPHWVCQAHLRTCRKTRRSEEYESYGVVPSEEEEDLDEECGMCVCPDCDYDHCCSWSDEAAQMENY